MVVDEYDLFRVTRDADLAVSDEADDLLAAVEDELRRRRFGEVVRLEVSSNIEPAMRERLVEWLDLAANQVYDEKGMLDLSDLWQIVGLDGHPELRQRSWTPQMHPSLRPRPDDTGEQTDIFAQ